MGHTVIEKHHTPLDRAAAKKLVDELEIALVTDDEVGEALEDDIADDVAIFIDKEKPPSAARAREKARETGYAEHSFVIDDAALDRLATCRTTITVQIDGRAYDHPQIARFQRRLLDGIGEGVVESDESTKWQTSEAFADHLSKLHGDAWEIEEEELAEEPLPISMPRTGNGEKESKKLRRKLQEAVDDPFVGKRVATAMRKTTPLVQKYAALLLQDDAQSDDRAAKELGVATGELTEARMALEALLAAAFAE